MGELITFVGLAGTALALLGWGLWALLHPFAGVWVQSTGSNSGCAGCTAPVSIAFGLGAVVAAWGMAQEVPRAHWLVAASLLLALAAAWLVGRRVAWRGIDASLDRVRQRLDEGYAPRGVLLERRTLADRVLRDGLRVELDARGPARPAAYREAPGAARTDLSPIAQTARRAARRHGVRVVLVALISASPAALLAVVWSGALAVDDGAQSILVVGAWATFAALALAAWAARQGVVAARTLAQILAARPEALGRGEALGHAVPAASDDGRAPSALDASAIADLADGWTGVDVGEGRRLRPEDVRARGGWGTEREMVWPTEARASSTYGEGYGAAEACKPPSVFPRYGDRRGAWAPQKKQSEAEWIELDFPSDAPPAAAIRVFETCAAGATYAVTDDDAEGETSQVVFARAPQPPLDAARLLEIPLTPARRVGRVRVHVSNASAQWAEIDAVGLVAAEEVPARLRRAGDPNAPGSRRWLTVGVAALVVVGLGLGWALVGRQDSAAREWHPTDAELASVVWASEIVNASSSHGDPRWHARQALGAPDVWPDAGDVEGAWAPEARNAGVEVLVVSFGRPITARALIVVETYGPGALRAIRTYDDYASPSSASGPRTLWEGPLSTVESSRVVRVDLDEPVYLEVLEIELDTSLVGGWNEIDAVGVIPHGQR